MIQRGGLWQVPLTYKYYTFYLLSTPWNREMKFLNQGRNALLGIEHMILENENRIPYFIDKQLFRIVFKYHVFGKSY